MIMSTLQERFEGIRDNSAYTLVTQDHPLRLYIGLDNDGNKAMKFRGRFKPDQIRDTAFIQVRHFQGTDYNTVVFSLLNDAGASIFYRFCEDLIEVTQHENNEQNAYRVLRDRYLHWRQLFSNAQQRRLAEYQILGLIGELLSLRDFLIPRYGLETALQGWGGQELTHKDFSYQDCWFEAKTLVAASTTVKIPSLEQLESDLPGKLLVFKMEKLASAADGIRLNRLVDEFLTMLTDPLLHEIFMEKISLQDYSYLPEYDDYVYRETERHIFTVNEEFPKLTRHNVPESISKATYEIPITAMLPFEADQI
jgi:hypothetical protein